MARRKIVAGNWKMNMTPSEAVALVDTSEAARCIGRCRRCILRTGD